MKTGSEHQDLRLVIVGHVDHGKSTLVGRLLYETNALPDGKYEQIKASCDKRGMAFEWAFLMDALQAERDQNVTIDTTQIWFSSATRRYCLIDAPGHREFLKNMITGAASADAALLLVDAQEGLKAQSRRHAYLLHLLGIREVIVVVNKMDLVEYSQDRFNGVVADFTSYLEKLDIHPRCFIPVSAREGDSIANRSEQMRWYEGETLLDAMDDIPAAREDVAKPLRFAVQDVYRFDDRRIIAGRIESGQMAVGDEVLFSPSNEVATVQSFEQWPPSDVAMQRACVGQSVGITLSEQIFVERGHVASHDVDAPLLTNVIQARIFWIQDRPMMEGARYRLRLATADYPVEVMEIQQVLDTDTLQAHAHAQQVERMQVADVKLRVRGLAVMDDYQANASLGRFVLFDAYRVAGGGIISTANMPNLRQHQQKNVKSTNISSVDFEITRQQRATQNGHKAGVLWFTGLSGSGKSTLAKELQQRLFMKGYQVYVLDGDNVRHGLCSDLGFSPEDRSENIRRVGEVASLFADAGFIVITAFISPYVEDRRRAQSVAADLFHTIYIKADVKTCESRDVKGLYHKARAGEIKDFTGVSAPYEEPQHPDLVVDTATQTVEQSVETLIEYVTRQFG